MFEENIDIGQEFKTLESLLSKNIISKSKGYSKSEDMWKLFMKRKVKMMNENKTIFGSCKYKK